MSTQQVFSNREAYIFYYCGHELHTSEEYLINHAKGGIHYQRSDAKVKCPNCMYNDSMDISRIRQKSIIENEYEYDLCLYWIDLLWPTCLDNSEFKELDEELGHLVNMVEDYEAIHYPMSV